ncbi:MAG: hypothetical protein AAGF66_04910 [Cyanobacteria bacterium P01_H01_bin.119]
MNATVNRAFHLPEPDTENITVLTENLPNAPILPWHRYDSPWIPQSGGAASDGAPTEVEGALKAGPNHAAADLSWGDRPKNKAEARSPLSHTGCLPNPASAPDAAASVQAVDRSDHASELEGCVNLDQLGTGSANLGDSDSPEAAVTHLKQRLAAAANAPRALSGPDLATAARPEAESEAVESDEVE